jgi:hypothetical protein
LLTAAQTDPADRARLAWILDSWGIAPHALMSDPDPAIRACAATASTPDSDPGALAEIRQPCSPSDEPEPSVPGPSSRCLRTPTPKGTSSARATRQVHHDPFTLALASRAQSRCRSVPSQGCCVHSTSSMVADHPGRTITGALPRGRPHAARAPSTRRVRRRGARARSAPRSRCSPPSDLSSLCGAFARAGTCPGDCAGAFGYGEGMGCFAAMHIRAAA